MSQKEARPDVLLGELCRPQDKKDAIHIAVVPVIADACLWPGQHLKFAAGSQERVVEARSRKFSIGIVDPFLDHEIQPGERFWMCLHPYTITSLRHEWTHPAFESTEPTVEAAKARGERIRQVTAALMGDEKWLRDFAKEVEVEYTDLIKSAHEYLDRQEYHVLPYQTPDIEPAKVRKFWDNFQAVTGREVGEEKKEEMFFSCSC